MKKIILVLMSIMSFNVFASQDDVYFNDLTDIAKSNYAEKKLKKCSDSGNYYCAGMLGAMYYENKNYSLAYPLLLKGAQNEKFGFFDSLLGEMFSEGKGVLQNDDKAIKFYIKAVKKNETSVAYNIGVIFNNKAGHLQYSYTPNGLAQYKYNLTRAYAWYQVSQAMGQMEMILKNGNKIPISKPIDEYKRELIQRGWLKEADKLSGEICSTIPECIQ